MHYPKYAQTPQRHLNSYIHSIIQHIKQFPNPVRFSEINDVLGINLYNNPMILCALKRNPKVVIERDHLQFKPKYDIRTKNDIKLLVESTNNEYGIEVNELLDCPVDIRGFVDELVGENMVYVLKDMDGSQIVFNNDTQIEPVTPEIKERWCKIRVPDYEEVRKVLNTAGLKSGYVEKKKRPAVELKKKQRRFRKKIKITNTHIKDLNFDG